MSETMRDCPYCQRTLPASEFYNRPGCNTALGNLKDSQDLLQAAIAYLSKSQS